MRWYAHNTELAYSSSTGEGPPVLLLHAGGFPEWFTPLAAAPALGAFRTIRMTRAGYTEAPAPPGLTIAGHAAHAAELLSDLGAAPAHVVAHSSGTTIALQLAVDHPELVRTLTLSEPPLVDALADPADHDLLQAMLGPPIGAALAAVARDDLPAAFAAFMTAVCGPAFRDVMVETLGTAVTERAERNCRYFFTDELAAVASWTLDAAQVHPPVLLVMGSDSPPPTHRLIAHLAATLPDAITATIAGAGHLLPLTAPGELGALIAEFAGAHEPVHR